MMLVLGRRVGEKIMVPQFGIEITIVEVRSNGVRIGFEAPRDVTIVREEVLLREQQDQLGKGKP